MTRQHHPLPPIKREPLPVGAALKGGAWAVAEFRVEGGRHLQYKALGKGMRSAALKEYFPPNWERIGKAMSPLGDAERENRLRDFYFDALCSARDLPGHAIFVTTYDLFQEAGTYFAVYEWVEGESLANMIRRSGAISWSELGPIAIQVGAALAHLHDCGMLHRDLTPLNILVEPDGKVKVCDYETVTPYPKVRGFEQLVFSNPDYAPIELLSIFPGYGPESDVYAFAASMYHAVTGARPPGSAKRVASQRLAEAHGVRPGVPVHVSAALDRAMKVRAKERTPTIAAFLDELMAENA